jgi:hypothetical protein
MSGSVTELDKPALPAAPRFREGAVFLGWICGLVFLGGLIWFLTQPVLSRFLIPPVNRILAQREEAPRLEAPVSLPRPPGASAPLGRWYSLEKSESLLFVFPLMRDGPLALCGAWVSPEGKVEEILPLSAHAEQVLYTLPQGMLLSYIYRIEAAAAYSLRKEEK